MYQSRRAHNAGRGAIALLPATGEARTDVPMQVHEDARLAALMRWYLEAGVDETIAEIPVDRLRHPGPAAGLATVPSVPGPRGADARAPHAPVPLALPPRSAGGPDSDDARTLAATADSLDALRVALLRFDGCPLRRTATNLVFGDGSPTARVVLIGEAPGAEEDRQGLPFVGPSGRLLDRMLASIGLDRSAVFISNTVFWRPPGNRAPTSQEVAACMPFVERIIELVAPGIVVALGGPAASALLGQNESVGRLRGRWFAYQAPRLDHPIPATALFHPAYLLRSPAQKRLAWRDLLAIKQRLTAVA